ncbi:MAG: DUF2892 domain-containing protein [Desulfobacterota bacterium]|nr:DUF2892 domain-containing protein [Thermodesulfobacteriota bacterium]
MESLEQNVGTIDRAVRAIVALIVLFVLVKMAALALLAGGMLLSSATSGVCPLYSELGICTVKEEQKKA